MVNEYLPIQYSQRDSRWKNDKLGYSDSSIETYGCLLTASATVLNHYGYVVNPKTLNNDLRKLNGFTGAYMYYNVLSTLYPVKVKLIQCRDIPAPLDLIDEALCKGIYPIVEVDASPKAGFQNHWVVIYKRINSEYWVSDPWTVDPTSELVTLTSRFGFIGDAKKIITNIFLIEPPSEKLKPYSNLQSQIETPPVSIEQPLEETNKVISTTVGDKLLVICDSLRVRSGPSITSTPIAMVLKGFELVSGGPVIKEGNINWQPVIMYVAANVDDEVYLKQKD